MWEGVLDRTKTATYWPPKLFWLSQPFFSVLLGCSTGSLGALPLLGHSSHSSIFSPTDLNFLSPGLYNNLTSTYFLRASQFALNLTPRQSRSPLISWYLQPDAPDIYTGASLIWQLGWVVGQYATPVVPRTFNFPFFTAFLFFLHLTVLCLPLFVIFPLHHFLEYLTLM